MEPQIGGLLTKRSLLGSLRAIFCALYCHRTYNASLIGQYTAAFHAQLREDCQGCDGCKWWDEDRPLPPNEKTLLGQLITENADLLQGQYMFWDLEKPKNVSFLPLLDGDCVLPWH